MNIDMSSFTNFFKSIFGKEPNDGWDDIRELIKEFKPFCTYDWESDELFLLTKDCSNLYRSVYNNGIVNLDLIYDAHTNELVGFLWSGISMLPGIEDSIDINFEFYIHKQANNIQKMWEQHSSFFLKEVLDDDINGVITDSIYIEMVGLIKNIHGVEHTNFYHMSSMSVEYSGVKDDKLD